MSLLHASAPARWRRQGLSSTSECQDPLLRDCSRAPFRLVVRGPLIKRPGPPGHVWMSSRRPVEGSARGADLVRDEVREVLAGSVQGRSCQKLPQDHVGARTAHQARLCQQDQVSVGLQVQLQELHDQAPLSQGLAVTTTLKDPPALREVPVDALQVVPLGKRCRRVSLVLHPPKGREFLSRRRHPGSSRNWRRRIPPIHMRVTRCWRWSWRCLMLLLRFRRWSRCIL